MTPKQSVVIASFSGDRALGRCLESLMPIGDAVEIIVVIAEDAPESRRRFPDAVWVTAHGPSDVFRLRALGVAAARGERIALTEDHCAIGAEWLAGIAAAHDAGHVAVGGPVSNGLRDAYHLALFLCEYGAYLSGRPDGPTDRLAGVNVSYERTALDACRAIWRESFRENEVNDWLTASGEELWWSGAARVIGHLDFQRGEALRHLFAGGRHFGGYRAGRDRWPVSLLRIAAAPLTPFVLLRRLMRAGVERDPSVLGPLLRGLPELLALLIGWSAGEAVGGALRLGFGSPK